MIIRFKYGNKCWWCGNDANSREHKYKRSDLKREFDSTKSFKGNPSDIVKVNVNTNKTLQIQSIDSNSVKFSKNLCSNCNNTISQVFDRDYDKFIRWILDNYFSLTNISEIDFSKIFKDETSIHLNNVFKYYAKNIACRLCQNEVRIEQSLIDYLNSEGKFPSCMIIQFRIVKKVYSLLELVGQRGYNDAIFFNHSLDIYETSNNNSYLYSKHQYKWFFVEFFYANDLNVIFNDYKTIGDDCKIGILIS